MAKKKENRGMMLDTLLEKDKKQTSKELKLQDDKLSKQSKVSNLNLYDFPMEVLSCGGKSYPNINIKYRSALTKEIRHWSSIVEDDPISVYNHINDILKECTVIIGGTYRDIKECDRLIIIMYIHKLTFPTPEKPFGMDIQCTACGTEYRHDLTHSSLKIDQPEDEVINKYLNPDTGLFELDTKTYGVVPLVTESIGVFNAYKEYLYHKGQKFAQENLNFFKIMPYYTYNYRVLNNKSLDKVYMEYCSWDAKKIADFTYFVDLVKTSISPFITTICVNENCNHENTPKLDFEEGITAFFLPISDSANELL